MKHKGVLVLIVLLSSACAQLSQTPAPPLASPAPAASVAPKSVLPSNPDSTVHKSPLGFTVIIPDGWILLGQDEIKRNANLFSADNPVFAHMDKTVIYLMKQKIESGQLEFYMSSSSFGLLYVDNITVAKQLGRVPPDSKSASQLCAQLPKLYSREFGKHIEFESCGLEKESSKSALHIVSSGVFPDTTSVQYILQETPSEMLIFTGTFNNTALAKEQKSLHSIVSSVRF